MKYFMSVTVLSVLSPTVDVVESRQDDKQSEQQTQATICSHLL